jgi:hypothetical protein
VETAAAAAQEVPGTHASGVESRDSRNEFLYFNFQQLILEIDSSALETRKWLWIDFIRG